MARATVTKLLLLVIVIFIICLPEFFRIPIVSKVNFFCLPYQHCEQRNRAKKGESGRPENAEGKRKDICDPSPAADGEKWEQICTQKNQNNLTEMWEVRDDPKMSWFMCETDKNMDELHGKISASGLKMHFEASVWLQLNDTKILIVTLNSRSNHSSLHFHPPEEVEDQAGDGEGQTEAIYCCLPLLPTSISANQSRCLLWLANQTVLTGTATEKLPWKRTDEDKWWCMIRVIWLALLCVVLLTVVTTVTRQIYFGKRLFKKPKVPPVGYHLNIQQLNVGETQPDVTSKARTTHQSFGLWSRLPPIQEVDSQNDVETLLDGNADHCYSGNLHHRGHPPASVPTEEQVS